MPTEPAFDGAAQAMSGMVDITGDPGGAPYMTGTYIVDYTSALYAAIGTLAALRSAEQTGRRVMTWRFWMRRFLCCIRLCLTTVNSHEAKRKQ